MTDALEPEEGETWTPTSLDLSPLEAGLVSSALRLQRDRLEKSLTGLRRKFGRDARTHVQEEKLALNVSLTRRLRKARR